MDVSVNPVLESVRPFFQGLPTNNTPSPVTSVGNSVPSHPAVATPVQPSQHGYHNNPPSSIPSSSPSVLSYWPQPSAQRPKEPQTSPSPSAKSPALASPLHHVYNGTKLESMQPDIPRHHNLPPVAALSPGMGYQHARAARDLAASQGALLHRQQTQAQHRPLPSISQITPHSATKTSSSSVSPRTTPSQFRAPDYPQSNHRSIYSPNPSSNQSHSRSSSSSSCQPQVLGSKYQSSPGSPSVSTPSPHSYSYSPRTSLPMSTTTTASTPSYPQTTSATSLYVSSSHHRQQLQNATQAHLAHQSRLPSNQQHQSHHPMSPVIQQPSQPDIYGHLKLHHQSQSNQQTGHSHHQHSGGQTSTPQHPSPKPPSSQPQPPHSQSNVARHHSHSVSTYHQQQQQQQQQQHRPATHNLQQMMHQQSVMVSSHQLLAQQHQQLQQQAALYNQSIQQNTRSEAEKQLADMQQALRMKQRQLAAAQQQQQPYYIAVPTSNSPRTPSHTSTTIVPSNNQRTITTQALSGTHKRESPLDLSVKTVRQSADSTAKDDSESAFLSNFQSHEAFQNRSKHTKTGNLRTSTLLPPLQLPSTVVYPHFDNHTTNQTASSGAPKVDFLPNFNTHHSSSLGNSTNFQDANKRQRNTAASQLPSPSKYPPHVNNLPHMGSFKKSILSSTAYDDPNRQTQYYPATGPPNSSRSTVSANHSPQGTQSAFTPTQNNQFPYGHTKRGTSARYDFVDRRNPPAASSESNYALGKRQSTSDLRHPLPPKIPRVVDTWRQTIDQQIEQRLNSYASSRGHQVNGITTKESIVNNETVLHQHTSTPYSSATSTSSNIQTLHSSVASSNSLVKGSSLFSSQRSNSSKLNLHNDYYQHNQPQYPHNTQRSMVQETYNDLTQVKLPSLPANGAADKRVLSILRKRLDTREASNQIAQQQLAQQYQSQLQERSKMYPSVSSRPYPQPLVVPSPVIASRSKSPAQPPQTQPLGRHNLPPFNALNLERNSVMPYSNQKLHIPKAMDSVVHEHSQSLDQSRAEIPSKLLPPNTDISVKPSSGENTADFDGLAAFLAARIRTKAELKQIGQSVEQPHQRTPTPASGSNSSAHSPRTTPGIFSPPPSVQINYPTIPTDFGKGTPASDSDRASSSGLGSSSPMKSSRDRYGINSPRRRLFYRPEDEPGGFSEGVILAREGGLRSSSETSVFDFRESDSDGETNSERQSLNEMRKDRDRRLQEKQHSIPAISPELISEITEIDDSPFINDSFWGGICDQFVNQLEKGGNKVKKIGRRKKLIYRPLDSTEPFEEYDTYKLESSYVDDINDEIEGKVHENEINDQENEIKVHANENFKDFKVNDIEDKSNIREVEVSKNEAKKIKLENISIKLETTVPTEDIEMPVLDNTSTLNKKIKIEEESSDEDVPLSLRQTELKKSKSVEVECSLNENNHISTSISEECDQSLTAVTTVKTENIKKECNKQEIKNDVSDSEAESSADESIETVAKRLRMRKSKEEPLDNKRITRSSEKENAVTPKKLGRKKKGEKKKSVYGDGSEFRPGWEAEVYRYKRSLRMPARLINIAGPQSWPRLSVSLPDLDPDSPMTLDSDISLQNKKGESDGESTPTKKKHTALSKCKNSVKTVEEKGEEDSFINRLVQRYGAKGKKSLRKGQEKDGSKERKGPKIIPQTNELTLLPTPSLDCIVKSPMKNLDSNSSNSKLGKKKKLKESDKSSTYTNSEGVFLGYFRKKTVADFRDAFAKHNGGFATENELPPIMLKSRTRTQTRILTQRATIREVFGEDRPASAPPAGCRDNESELVVKPENGEKKTKKSMKNKVWLGKRNNSSNLTISTRSGLRCAFVLRSNKAILKSKQHLLHGGARRKRSKDLIKAYSTKHHKDKKDKEDNKIDSKLSLMIKPLENVIKVEAEVPVHPIEKRFKIRSVRRKLKSSGFDYIRKKKKQQQKKDGESEAVKEKKKVVPIKSNLESEEDIQNEIKAWVINKGLGETVLHRAARLGYKDIAAYCLEKMDHNPSPRDNAGYTPLHEACSKGRLEIAKMLLQYGADVSDSAQGGIRPLHEAAENGNLELIRLLLSYGADPLLATYSGHTPFSLTCHNPDARALMQNHLADVQGLPAEPWQLPLTDWSLLGCDPICEPLSPDPCDCEMEVESGELSLPHLYQLLGEPHTDRWVLFQELGPVLRVKTREALIKQLGQAHRHDFRDLKMTDFYDMARCCSVLGVGDYILNPKAHKVTLVKYSDRVRALLNSEKIMVTAR